MQGGEACACGALADIVGYVSIYARPIHCLPHLGLHPINTLICSVHITKGVIEELWRNADSFPLDDETGNNRQFIPGTPEMSGNVVNFLPVLRQTSKGEVIDIAIHQVMFHGALNDVQFSFS